MTVFEGLAEVLQNVFGEFTEFIEEEDAAVREANFTRLGEGTAAD